MSYSVAAVDSSTLTSSVLVWATRSDLAEALVAALEEPGRMVRALEQDADLVSAHNHGSLMVAELEPRLEQQQAFVRGPFVLLDPNRAAPHQLARRAYAVVSTVSEAALAVDRFFEHRRLAQAAANRRVMPGRCSRCGRPFDGARARTGS